MKHKSSYSVQIKDVENDLAHALKLTQTLYREALSFVIPIVEDQWNALSKISGNTNQRAVIEHLIHTAGKHVAVYDFDDRFPKMPSYMRRALITDAIGKVSSYKSNYDNWVAGGKKGRPPKLAIKHAAAPAFYNTNMFTWDSPAQGESAHIKLYDGHDWTWHEIRLAKTDVSYIAKHCTGRSMSAPVLQQKGKVWRLRFAFKMDVELTGTPQEKARACCVDLGVGNAATCCVMEADGTVLSRRFVKLDGEEDRLHHMLNKLRKSQRLGACNLSNKWARINDLNTEISRKTAGAIVDYAIEWSCDVIVFEFLDLKGRIRGKSRRQRLALWRAKEVQSLVEERAHAWGMRISRVCAWNTSRLAFDGSGRVKRGREIAARNGEVFGYGTVEFANGKLYSADLNAAYNIGARYFIRGLLKTCLETERSMILAKVPESGKRSTCTLGTLNSIRKVLGSPAVQSLAWRPYS